MFLRVIINITHVLYDRDLLSRNNFLLSVLCVLRFVLTAIVSKVNIYTIGMYIFQLSSQCTPEVSQEYDYYDRNSNAADDIATEVGNQLDTSVTCKCEILWLHIVKFICIVSFIYDILIMLRSNVVKNKLRIKLIVRLTHTHAYTTLIIKMTKRCSVYNIILL